MLKATFQRQAARLLTSPVLRQGRQALAALPRRLRGRDAVVHYFHQADDPYSALAAALLPALRERYRVRIEVHGVAAPEAAAAPDRARLAAWSQRDAARLAAHFGLQPAALSVAADGTALRQKLGHYLGATFYFEGEWYWGVDRLHYLEARLAAAGLSRHDNGPLLPPPVLQWQPSPPSAHTPQLHFFCSLRSPYTWLAAARVRQLATHYGAELKLRYVLPMVMRGLPVPLAKRLYILRDTKREAERLGLPFGCIVDPVGAATERGLALLQQAIALGRGPALLESFLQGVFAEGIDGASDRGLARIAARAGLGAAEIKTALADESWRALAEANRQELLEDGLWGVPSFRVDERPALWGQDRLWMVEQDLLARLRAPGAI